MREDENGGKKGISSFQFSNSFLSSLCLVMSVLIILLSLGLSALSRGLSSASLVISEVMSGNTKTLFDAACKTPDWIELYNASEKAIDLNGYSLTDSMEDINQFVFPKISIPSGGTLMVYASETSGMIGNVYSTGFKLSKEGETLYLVDPNDNIVAQLMVASLDPDISYAMRSDGSYGYCACATPGEKNEDAAIVNDKPTVVPTEKTDSAVSEYLQSHTSLFDPSSVYINEVCAANATGSESNDWIELYNGSDSDVDLSGYSVSDDRDNPAKWKIPSLIIAAKGYAILEASPTTAQDNVAPFGISPTGETLIMCNLQGDIIDVFDTGVLRTGTTSGRVESDNTIQRVYFDTPTKGKHNAENWCTTYAATPVLSDNTLYHTDAFSLSLSCTTPNAIIYYTTDGTKPTISSLKYTGPVSIKENTSVRAIAVADGCLPSDDISRTFLFDVPHTVPVVCLSGKSSELNVVLNVNVTDYKPEYEIFTEYYETDGTLGVAFPSGLRPKGKSSLSLPQNSLTIALRNSYGQQSVTYPFFPQSDIQTFSNLSLRNAGQDAAEAKIRDSFVHEVCNGINIDTVHTRPVVVYINGKYYGLYDLVEEQNEEYLASYYNVDSNDIELVNHRTTRITGESAEYKRIIQYAQTWKLSDDEIFADFAKLVDVDACIDYLVAQIYFGNGDVINNRFWRTSDYFSKWRPLFFDLDFCLRYNNENRNVFDKYLTSTPSIGGMDSQGNTLTTELYIFNGLMKNKTWRERFVQRFVQLAMTQFGTQRVLVIFDSMTAQMQHEMQAHIQRWHRPASLQTWQNEIAGLRSALEKRQSIALKQLQNYFHVSDEQMQAYIQKYTPASDK